MSFHFENVNSYLFLLLKYFLKSPVPGPGPGPVFWTHPRPLPRPRQNLPPGRSIIVAELSIKCDYLKTNQITRQPGIAWYKVEVQDINEYKSELDRQLDDINFPTNALQCRDFKCNRHFDELEKFHNSIINSCILSGQKSLPVTGKCRMNDDRNRRIGWNEYCKEKRETAIMWHNKWKEEGRPHNSFSAVMRRVSRLQFHYSVKCIDKNKDIIRSNMIASQFISDPKNAWNKCHKFKGGNNKVPNIVDGVTGDKNISEIFSNI